MIHTTHSSPNALLRQLRSERRQVTEAWQFGFFCGAVLSGAASIALVVPLVLWIVK